MLSDSKTSTFQRTEQDFYRQRPNQGVPNGPQPLADDQAWQANVYQPPHMPQEETSQIQHPWPKPGLQITAAFRERDGKLEKIRRHCDQIRAITYDPATVLEFSAERLANLKSLAQALSLEIETLSEGMGAGPPKMSNPPPQNSVSGYPSHQSYNPSSDGYPSMGSQGMFPRPNTPQTPPQIVSQPPPVNPGQGYPYDYYQQPPGMYGAPGVPPNGKSAQNGDMNARFAQQPASMPQVLRQPMNPHFDLPAQQDPSSQTFSHLGDG